MSDLAAANDEVAAASSTLSWRGLRDLLFAPRRFFSRGLHLADRPEVTFATWIVGVSIAFDRLTRLPAVQESWIGTWVFVSLAGIVIGGLRWYVAGWFYGVRLKWSGAVDPDDELARSVNIWQDFVMAAPHLLWAIVVTFVYPTYAAASADILIAGGVLALFIFWSCITSYVGATTAFPKVSRARAALWFLALPLLFHTILILVASS